MLIGPMMIIENMGRPMSLLDAYDKTQYMFYNIGIKGDFSEQPRVSCFCEVFAKGPTFHGGKCSDDVPLSCLL